MDGDLLSLGVEALIADGNIPADLATGQGLAESRHLLRRERVVPEIHRLKLGKPGEGSGVGDTQAPQVQFLGGAGIQAPAHRRVPGAGQRQRQQQNQYQPGRRRQAQAFI